MDNSEHIVTNGTGYIFDIKRFAIHDGPGIRTTIFFKGCPLRCWWCHNPESHRVLPEKFEGCNTRRGYNRQLADDFNEVGKEVTVKYLINEIEKERVFYEEYGGGVTFSGGEPLMQPGFLSEVLLECKQKDINTVIDTGGYAPWKSFEKIIEYTDLFLFDIKLVDSSLHEKYTGQPNKLILQNLLNLDKCDKKFYLRIPIVPEITDTDNNMGEVINLISSLNNVTGVNLLPYHNTGSGKYDRYKTDNYLHDTPLPSEEKMEELKNKFLKVHTNVTVGG